MAATTRHIYLLNARSFLKHFRTTPPALSRLSVKTINGLVAYYDSLIKSHKRPVVLRRHEVKKAKSKVMHTQEELRHCLRYCRDRLPEILGEFSYQFDRILLVTGEKRITHVCVFNLARRLSGGQGRRAAYPPFFLRSSWSFCLNTLQKKRKMLVSR